MIRGIDLARDYASGPQDCIADLQEAFRRGRDGEPGGIGPHELSVQDLAAHFILENGRPIGMDGVHRLYDPARSERMWMQEAESAVDSTAFLNITGQLIVNAVMTGYQSDEFVASRLIPNTPTKLSGEKIPGITSPSDPGQDSLLVRESQEYPHFGVSETYVETPETFKRGLIISVTKEAIFFDRTGQLVSKASEVGEVLGLNKEKRLLDLIIGGTKVYKRNGTTYWTYYSANDTGAPWVNHLSNNALADWTDIDNAEDLFSAMTNPDTGEPIVITARHLFCVRQLRSTASRVLNATEVRSGSSNIVISANPLAGMGLTLASSALLYARLIATDTYGHSVSAANAKGYWFYGDLTKAFTYMENWPISVSRAPANSEVEFSQDIVARFKASERGAAAVRDPRYIVRCRADATSSSSGS